MSGIVQAAFGAGYQDRLHAFIRQIQKDNVKSARHELQQDERFAAIEADIGLLALLTVGLMKSLSEHRLLDEGRLLQHLAALDRLDGREDGALDMDSFRDVIGVKRGQSLRKPAAASPAPKAITASTAAAKGKGGAARPAATPARAAAKPAPKPATPPPTPAPAPATRKPGAAKRKGK